MYGRDLRKVCDVRAYRAPLSRSLARVYVAIVSNVIYTAGKTVVRKINIMTLDSISLISFLSTL